MAADVGPGTPLVCIKWVRPEGATLGDACSKLTVDAIYICKEVGHESVGTCPWDDCGKTWYSLEGKYCGCHNMDLPYCPNLFRPLNDGDTSLVDAEVTYDMQNGIDLHRELTKEKA